MSHLQIDNVNVIFPAGPHAPPVQALKDVNLGIDSGEFVVALGASGCGKSTLLNLMAGFLAPSNGSIRWFYSGASCDRAVRSPAPATGTLSWTSRVVRCVRWAAQFANQGRARVRRKAPNGNDGAQVRRNSRTAS